MRYCLMLEGQEGVTWPEWMAAAQAHTTIDLGPFFRAWIYSPTAPAHTAANGFRE